MQHFMLHNFKNMHLIIKAGQCAGLYSPQQLVLLDTGSDPLRPFEPAAKVACFDEGNRTTWRPCAGLLSGWVLGFCDVVSISMNFEGFCFIVSLCPCAGQMHSCIQIKRSGSIVLNIKGIYSLCSTFINVTSSSRRETRPAGQDHDWRDNEGYDDHVE